MSLDIKLLLIGSIMWILMALYYVNAGIMIEGARVWGAGSAIFFILFLAIRYAERRGAKAFLRSKPLNTGNHFKD
jgi:hypothetical protein